MKKATIVSEGKPVNASKQPKGTIFGAPTKVKPTRQMKPALKKSLKKKGLTRNYSI